MFILASQSPRRKALLQRVVPEFTAVPAQINERETPVTKPADYVQILARRKGQQVATNYPTATILSADTVVSFQATIYGKPSDRQAAAAVLRQLSGQTHQVYTGIWLKQAARVQQAVVRTDVTFWPLSEDQIATYLDQNNYQDKAGAYGIQGPGSLLVEKINGDFYNVMGLPISTIARML